MRPKTLKCSPGVFVTCQDEVVTNFIECTGADVMLLLLHCLHCLRSQRTLNMWHTGSISRLYKELLQPGGGVAWGGGVL